MSADKPLWLEVIGAEGRSAELPRQGVLSVGSSPERADFVIEGQGVAEVHCAIGRTKGGGWALKDLGSEYGTTVNGEAVKAARLKEGDRITMGSKRMQVVDKTKQRQNAAAATPEPPKQRSAQEQPAAKASSKSKAKEKANPQAKASGKTAVQVAGFRIEGPLGRGAMGNVFLAVQESLNRKVALKVLSPKYSGNPEFVQNFVAEARSAAALHHANIVTVFDVGEDRGQHYLAMEYMDRASLDVRLAKEGPLALPEALRVLEDAAKGLLFAEQKGIVHRDIKPANLMQNENGETKIADLGLATNLEADADEAAAAGDKKIFGTPHFISPEQARGERVDARSDLYSLGATAYRLLSGRTPFEGETTRDILKGHFFEEPQRLESLVPNLPREVADLVHRLLEKKPEDRYASAQILLRDVELLRAGAPRPAGPATTSSGETSSSSKRWLFIGGGLVAASALIFALISGGDDDDGQSNDSRNTGSEGNGANVAENSTEPGNGEINSENPEGLEENGIPGVPDTTDVNGVNSALANNSGGTGNSLSEGDNDRELQVMELQAELAYERITTGLSPTERIVQLNSIIAEFPGTTIANKSTQEVTTLQGDVASAIRAEREQDKGLDEARKVLRSAALLDRPNGGTGSLVDSANQDTFHPAAALQGFLNANLDPATQAHAGYAKLRREVFSEIGRRGREQLKDLRDEVQALEAQGDFENSSNRISGFLAGWNWPKLPTDARVEELVMLELEAAEFKVLLEQTGTRRDYFVWSSQQADAVQLGKSSVVLESQLMAFDLGAVRTQLQTSAQQLRSAEGRELANNWDAECAASLRALELLRTSFEAGEWRRKALLDPRPGKSGSSNVVGITKDGVRIQDGAEAILVEWAVFAVSTKSFDQLFHERLNRDFSSAERGDIASLMRMSANLQVLSNVLEMFYPERQAHFTKGESKDALSGFEEARSWVERANDPVAEEEFKADVMAAKLLSEILLMMENGQWTASAAGLEGLLDEHRDRLLVRLLSDGSGLSDPAPSEPVDHTPAPAIGGKRKSTDKASDGQKPTPPPGSSSGSESDS